MDRTYDLTAMNCKAAAATAPKVGTATLALIIRHLDWKIPTMQDADYVISRLADIFQKFPALLSPEKVQRIPAGRGILFRSLVTEIRQTVGEAVFDEAYTRVCAGDLVVACGLASAELFGPLTCVRCGAHRLSRLYCCTCGCVFSIKNELGRRSLERSRTLQLDMAASSADLAETRAATADAAVAAPVSVVDLESALTQREVDPARRALNAAALAGKARISCRNGI